VEKRLEFAHETGLPRTRIALDTLFHARTHYFFPVSVLWL
jgi:hypothetical protein